MWLYYKLLIRLSIDGYFGCFQVLAVPNKVAVNIHTEVFIWTCSPNNSFSLGQVPRNGMARSYDRCMFNL